MIQFSNYENSTERDHRLIRTFLHLSPRVRSVISSMHDHKGNLSVVVTKILPDLSEQIKDAWEGESELSVEIEHNGKMIYSTWRSEHEWI
jgi:hypothetical protein